MLRLYFTGYNGSAAHRSNLEHNLEVLHDPAYTIDRRSMVMRGVDDDFIKEKGVLQHESHRPEWAVCYQELTAMNAPGYVFFFRADARLTVDLLQVIIDWCNMDRDFLIIRGHPFHANPVEPGLWGARFQDALFERYLAGYPLNHVPDTLALFLTNYIWPLVTQENTYEHDTVYKKTVEGAMSFFGVPAGEDGFDPMWLRAAEQPARYMPWLK